MSCGVYQIRNVINGKKYYGSSKEIEERWKRHITDLRAGKHHNIKLQRAFIKYGENAFVFEIVELRTESDLLIREQHYLDNNKNGYNIGLKASGGDNLTNHPNKKDIVRRMTESVKKRYAERTSEEREQYSKKMTGEGNPNYGKRWGKELRERMSQRRTGVKASPETKAKIGIASKERWKNEEYKQKNVDRMLGEGNPFYGKKHSKETKEKLRIKNTGKKYSAEHVKAMSKNMEDFYNSEKGQARKKEQSKQMSGANHFLYGVGHTKESREKMSQSTIENWKNMTKEDFLKLPRIKIIKIESKLYLGAKLAARYLQLSTCALSFRCKSINPKWKDFQIVEKVNLTPEQIDNLIWR